MLYRCSTKQEKITACVTIHHLFISRCLWSLDMDKAIALAEQRLVKLHLFLPSNRRILTVIGKMYEYWVDMEHRYCTCKGYYFRLMHTTEVCYHLSAALYASKEGLTDTIVFSDDEYEPFLRALIIDTTRSILE